MPVALAAPSSAQPPATSAISLLPLHSTLTINSTFPTQLSNHYETQRQGWTFRDRSAIELETNKTQDNPTRPLRLPRTRYKYRYKFYDYQDGLHAQDVRVAAYIGQLEASDHIFTAGTGTTEREYSFIDVVLTIRPEQQMTWGSFYVTNIGIEWAFHDTLENETSFDISEDGIGAIGSGGVVYTALVRDWSI